MSELAIGILPATIWALTVAVAHALWRPPAPLVARVASVEVAEQEHEETRLRRAHL